MVCRKALARIVVFKACELDRPGVESLLDGMPGTEAKLEAFDTACASNLCAVARLGVCPHKLVPGLHAALSCTKHTSFWSIAVLNPSLNGQIE